ncbi:hypothetical protein E3O42_03115 [Cryobacterium adonitolivorans]|uniref:VanZ family protein n=1 Tax=Cryobacterium adonitolivorans TaxID=1259189 RepID=A0A4R8WA38_9MICO|nr:hypothetical protein [Cryobacterium adonitolivorans]TFC05557.1 hypothetical protein E3O42_03115 [Cryobacterium adonitolivorans]
MNALAHRRHAALRRAARWLAATDLLSLALIAFWPTPLDVLANTAGTALGALLALTALAAVTSRSPARPAQPA